MLLYSTVFSICSASDGCDEIEFDTDYSGNDLQVGGKYGRIAKVFKSAEECRRACAAMKDCAAFVFVKSQMNQHNCAVKSKWAPATKKKNRKCCDSGKVTKKCRDSYQGNILI